MSGVKTEGERKTELVICQDVFAELNMWAEMPNRRFVRPGTLAQELNADIHDHEPNHGSGNGKGRGVSTHLGGGEVRINGEWLRKLGLRITPEGEVEPIKP